MFPSHQPRVLLICEAVEESSPLVELLEQRGFVPRWAAPDDPAFPDLLRESEIAAFVLQAVPDGRLRDLIEDAAQARVATLVQTAARRDLGVSTEANVDWVGLEATREELVGRIAGMSRFVPVVRRLDAELQHLQRLAQQLNRYFGAVDKEMRLAGRLQRDFMPATLPPQPPFRFAHLFRPATWVSGDIFDVFPIHDDHVGVFIADAMGHGTAAGLMTMYLRKSLNPLAATPTVHPTPPARALGTVHEGLARHALPHGQFITAAYALFNRATLELRVARGGHPYPLLLRADDTIEELRPEGGLLGLRDLDPEVGEASVRLGTGDRVVFYTDGIEELFVRERDETATAFTPQLNEWRHFGAEDLTAAVADFLDQQEGSLNPADDVTLVVAEVAD